MKYCIRCGKKLEDSDKCNCMDTTIREFNTDNGKENIKSLYESDLWKRMVDSIKKRSKGLDEWILYNKGLSVQGCIVHHIYPSDKYPAMRLLPMNLIYVSKKTHEWIHYVYSFGKEDMHEITRKMFKIVLSLDRSSVEWYYKELESAERRGKKRKKVKM